MLKRLYIIDDDLLNKIANGEFTKDQLRTIIPNGAKNIFTKGLLTGFISYFCIAVSINIYIRRKPIINYIKKKYKSIIRYFKTYNSTEICLICNKNTSKLYVNLTCLHITYLCDNCCEKYRETNECCLCREKLLLSRCYFP